MFKSIIQHITCYTVPGGWGEWGAYGECSAPCGGGYKGKHRYCNNPAPAYGGTECYGSDYYNTTCNTHHCPSKYLNLLSKRQCLEYCTSV